MQIKNYTFAKLPFSNLFQAYSDDFSEIAEFYETNPHQPQTVKKRASSFKFSGSSEKSADLLAKFNQQFDVEEAALANINRLRKDDALAIVTGQQLGLYGGPLYTIYKTLTTIHLAREWERMLGRPVIPVFWLADEDHDYDEVRSVQVLGDEKINTFSLPQKKGNMPPVSEMQFPEEIKELGADLRETLIDTDFSDDLWKLLDQCFNAETDFLRGFGTFIARLFSKHGLVLAGSNNKDIKAHIKEPLIRSVEQAERLYEALEKQSQKIGREFHQQAAVYNSHLFYLDDEQGRIKIQRQDETWSAGVDLTWHAEELVSLIESSPEKFSPDVFLRPIIQDRLLPTLGYVAGPGEIAYYGQMKTFYAGFNTKMPVIFPRLSATLIEAAIDRVLKELPFELSEYNRRIEDLESDFVDRSEQLDIEAVFDDWKEEVTSMAASPKEKIVSVDKTLGGAVEKSQAAYFNALNQLKGKVYQAVKKNEKIQINRIHRIQQNLFPERSLQERAICGIYYMNKYGMDIWDELLEEMENERLYHHKLVYL